MAGTVSYRIRMRVADVARMVGIDGAIVREIVTLNAYAGRAAQDVDQPATNISIILTDPASFGLFLPAAEYRLNFVSLADEGAPVAPVTGA